MSEENFLSRWSRLKRTGGAAEAPAPKPVVAAAPAVASGTPAAAPAPVALPPVESLEPGADISLFMRAEVEQGLKRQAFKKLLQDPRFNVMDGLDVYIDDYSQPDPLPAGWLEKMNQNLRLGEYREPEAKEEALAQQPAPAVEPAAQDAAAEPDAAPAQDAVAAQESDGAAQVAAGDIQTAHTSKSDLQR